MPRGRLRICIAVYAWAFLVHHTVAAGPGASVSLDAVSSNSHVLVNRTGSILRLHWPTLGETATLCINLDSTGPLVRSVGLTAQRQPITIAENLDPLYRLTIGQRDPAKSAKGMVFFDNPRERPYTSFSMKRETTHVAVSTTGGRGSVTVNGLQAGSFRGDLRFHVYAGTPLIHMEAVVSTSEPNRAFLYDAGICTSSNDWQHVAWKTQEGSDREKVEPGLEARNLSVPGRCVAVETTSGSLAVFPAPHQYFYPLDFADNFPFNWYGPNYEGTGADFGVGIRQPPEGDKRWVPWIDAPVGSAQRLACFLLLSTESPDDAREQVMAFTRHDQFEPLDGHKVFTSHYHVEHTVDYLDRQKDQQTSSIPMGLETPGFVTKFRNSGIDIVHLAEFHHGWTPGQKAPDRLKMLRLMHDECARLSDKDFLLLPGEEPNVHLGGHWISFFPKPVNWVLNRAAGEPFSEEVEGYGTVYRVGNSTDVLRLMEAENGLMWTAHPRIKSSLGFPDAHRHSDFYKSPHFLGAAWKAMPSDLSQPRLGWRVLDLLDDMNQWGQRKQALGEVDVFRVEPWYELYAHMNVNYLRLDTLPDYRKGWQPVLDCLRDGKFFVTTGEILLVEFSGNGRLSGETIAMRPGGKLQARVILRNTFPLDYLEYVLGNGKEVTRRRVDLSSINAYAGGVFSESIDVKDNLWIRMEVWDVARNGAFSQPLWIERSR